MYQFAGVTALANNLRFTLGTTNSSQTPLPIELVSFTARALNKAVELNWQTASEINNDYFTIERSKNGSDWEEIKRVDGAGTSLTVLNYSITDQNPYPGNSYYRLKQTDFDGQFEYFQVRNVRLGRFLGSHFEFYPNPVLDRLTIKGADLEMLGISICNFLGQEVTPNAKLISRNEHGVVVDFSSLLSGVYYIKIGATVNRIIKK